jgi:N-acetylglucosaminyldiphosphoundecaprenol N-acetyl-beta-D-mannosaminyltransferase
MPPDRASTIADFRARHSRLGIMQRRARFQGMRLVWRFTLLLGSCAKRMLDLLLSVAFLIALSPVVMLIVLLQRMRGRPILQRETRLGRWSVPFQLIEFDTHGSHCSLLRRLKLHRLPTLVNVIRGDISLIGPRASTPQGLSLRQRAVRKRSSIRPGILSLWWLRKRANIAFGSELDVDLEYVDQQSVRGDFGIALRVIPCLLYGSGSAAAPDQVDILGIPIRNITLDETLDYILAAPSNGKPRQLCFVNTDCLNKAQRDAAYAGTLIRADTVVADGIGIRIAGKLTRQEIRQNVNGTDLFPLLCHRLQNSEAGLFLLGGRPGVVEEVRDWIDKYYPGAKVKGMHHGYFAPEMQATILRTIRESEARILLVGFGSPRQDMWIAEHLAEAGVDIALGVGGLFDFYSGRIRRAPQWLRELSLEWAFRLCQEPSRMWKRYLLGNLVFLFRVLCWMTRRPRAIAASA